MNNISKIRSACIKDAPALLNIYSWYVKNTAITFEWDVPSVQEFEDRIKATLEKYPYIVAEICDEEIKDTGKSSGSGIIVGYAYASRFKERKAYDWCAETSIYVHKDYRRKKIGEKLLAELEQMLQKQGILNVNACITNPVVPDEHLTDASRRFHQKMGYSFVGEFHKCGYKFNRWYNMIWMEKFIGNHLEIRTAKPADFDRIMSIYHFAQDFMIQSGNPTQWAHKYPDDEMVNADIEGRRCILICENDKIHGVFALFDNDDPTYRIIENGAWLNDKPYVTIHRIASDGKVRGVFKCAADYCKSIADNIRIDTHADNLTMQHLIEKNGFKKCGTIYVSDGTPRIAYQWSKNQDSKI